MIYCWSKRRYVNTALLLFLAIIVIILLIRYLIFSDLIEYTLFFSVCFLGVFIYYLHFIIPPTFLFLGLSDQYNIVKMSEILSKFSNHHGVSLFNINVIMDYNTRYNLMFSNIRTRNLYEWRSIAYYLMDIVPVIVLLYSDKLSDKFNEEINRIKFRGYQDRTVLIYTEEDKIDDVNKFGPGFTLVKIAIFPNWLNNYLSSYMQNTTWRKRHNDYIDIVKNIPNKFRFSDSLLTTVVQSRYYSQYAMDKFIREVKGINPEEVGDRILFDIPSGLTQQEEIKYLRASRSLEEERILLLSALYELEQRTDKNVAYSRANTINSLGLLFYRQGYLKQAIEHITLAIKLLKDILIDLKEEDEEIQYELATAYFNLAEVFTVCSRMDNNLEEINKALLNYNKCVEIENKIGKNSDFAQMRISNLIKLIKTYHMID